MPNDICRTPQEVREAALRMTREVIDEIRLARVGLSGPLRDESAAGLRVAKRIEKRVAALVVETTPRKETALGRGTIRGWMSTENFLALALSPKDQNPYFCASIHTGLPDDAFAEGGWEQVTLSRAASPPDEGTTPMLNGQQIATINEALDHLEESWWPSALHKDGTPERKAEVDAHTARITDAREAFSQMLSPPAAETTSEDTRK